MSKVIQQTEANIQSFQGLQAVRKRPTMYMGKRGNSMLTQMILEVIDNSFDEYLAGRNQSVHVEIDTFNDLYRITDQGGGIPVGLINDVPALTRIMTELHTGGKFSEDAYKVARGVHGIGVSAVNALSKSFVVFTRRDNTYYRQSFAFGIPTEDLKVVKCKKKFGTCIEFEPDHKIIDSDEGKAKVDLEVITDYIYYITGLNPGFSVSLSIDGKNTKYVNKHIKQVIEEEVKKLGFGTTVTPIYCFSSSAVSGGFCWVESDEPVIKSFISSSQTKNGGTHESVFKSILINTLGNYKKQRDSYKPLDLLSGLIAFIDYKTSEPSFTSQTKEEYDGSNVVVAKDFECICNVSFNNFIKKHARVIISRACQYRKLKDDFTKNKKALSEAKKSHNVALSGMLVTCPRAKPRDRELYLVEGESAFGTAKSARNAKYQEIVRVDGKILNALKTTKVKLLQNKKIVGLLHAIGYDFSGKGRDVTRVGKVILLSDSDVDGGHIDVLECITLYKFLPFLFDQNRVFAVDAPLFSVYYKNKLHVGKTLEEIQAQVPVTIHNSIVRSKGWGEIDVNTLSRTAFKEETRSLIQININRKQNNQFELLVGEDTSARKLLIGV